MRQDEVTCFISQCSRDDRAGRGYVARQGIDVEEDLKSIKHRLYVAEWVFCNANILCSIL